METLMRELNALKDAPAVTHQQLVGAVVAAASRIDALLDERMVGIQALAMAVAMQPGIDANRLHRDFLAILERQFDPARPMPEDLRDMVTAIGLAAAEAASVAAPMTLA